MFNHIAGTLDSKTLTEAVVDAGGVGYLLRIPLSTSSALPNVGQRVKLLAYQHISQDAQILYGFSTESERGLFLQLLTVSGVGPKSALAVLSGGAVADIQQAIRQGDYAALKRIKGIGDGTAKKIVLELGKILIHQPNAAGKKGSAAVISGNSALTPGLDEETDLAAKTVMQLQEISADIALQAVQRAFSELSAISSQRPQVQDVVRRAMRYT